MAALMQQLALSGSCPSSPSIQVNISTALHARSNQKETTQGANGGQRPLAVSPDLNRSLEGIVDVEAPEPEGGMTREEGKDEGRNLTLLGIAHIQHEHLDRISATVSDADYCPDDSDMQAGAVFDFGDIFSTSGPLPEMQIQVWLCVLYRACGA